MRWREEGDKVAALRGLESEGLLLGFVFLWDISLRPRLFFDGRISVICALKRKRKVFCTGNPNPPHKCYRKFWQIFLVTLSQLRGVNF